MMQMVSQCGAWEGTDWQNALVLCPRSNSHDLRLYHGWHTGLLMRGHLTAEGKHLGRDLRSTQDPHYGGPQEQVLRAEQAF